MEYLINKLNKVEWTEFNKNALDNMSLGGNVDGHDVRLELHCMFSEITMRSSCPIILSAVMYIDGGYAFKEHVVSPEDIDTLRRWYINKTYDLREAEWDAKDESRQSAAKIFDKL